MLEKALTNYLLKHNELKAIHKGRVCAGIAPEKWEAPYMTLFLISNPPEMRRLGRPVPRIQISHFAKTYGQVRQMADLTIQAIDGFSGIMVGVSDIKVIQSISEDPEVVYENDTGLYHCPVDFRIILRKGGE